MKTTVNVHRLESDSGASHMMVNTASVNSVHVFAVAGDGPIFSMSGHGEFHLIKFDDYETAKNFIDTLPSGYTCQVLSENE